MINYPDNKTQYMETNHYMDLPKLEHTVSKLTHHHHQGSNSSQNLSEAFQIEIIRTAFDNAKCQSGHEAFQFCSNPNCQKNAIVCFNKKCICRKTHRYCSNANFDGFLDSYEIKIKAQKIAIEKVENIFEKLIDNISEIEDQIIKTIRGSFLTSKQSQFAIKIQNSDFSEIKGKQIAQIFTYINQQDFLENQNTLINLLIEEMKDLSNQSIKSFQKVHKDIKKLKNSENIFKQKKQQQEEIQKIKNSNEIDSKIVIVEEQIQTLKHFFDKKTIKSMKLLYRASEDKFSIEKFYEKCSNIPHTLILIKTDFDKIIGGYTPLIWKNYEGVIKKVIQDPSFESFTFSVTQNEKLKLQKKEDATYYLSYAPGPRFGKQGCADLWVCDQSNKIADSYVFGNMSYANPKYSSTMNSYEKFVGGPTEYFKTKEWEVFQVTFQ